jgi:hypothetical protein
MLLALSALYAPVDCEAVLFHLEQFQPRPLSNSPQADLSDLACFPGVGFAEDYASSCILENAAYALAYAKSFLKPRF